MEYLSIEWLHCELLRIVEYSKSRAYLFMHYSNSTQIVIAPQYFFNRLAEFFPLEL